MAKALFALKAYASGTNTELMPVPAGSRFDLALKVQDLRPPGSWSWGGQPLPLVRGVFAAYCDLAFDRSRVWPEVVEVQTVSVPLAPGTMVLEVSGHSTPPLAYNVTSPAQQSLTALYVANALNQILGAGAVTVAGGPSGYRVTFSGLPNVEIPPLASPTPGVSMVEVQKGDVNDPLAFLHSLQFSSYYPNGKQGYLAGGGIDRLGAFSGYFSGLGTNLYEVVRVPMRAGPAVGAVPVAIDFAHCISPSDDVLVYGNWGAQPPEQSLVLPADVKLSPVVLRLG